MPEPGPPLFFDTVTLSNFALAGRVDLLTDRYGDRIHLTTEVQDELAEGIAAGYPELGTVLAPVEEGWTPVTLSPEERCDFQGLLRTLSIGEASCLAGAAARRGIVVTDDRAARALCAERSLPYTGTIGILIACCRSEALSPPEADALLAKMVECGFFAPVRSTAGLL